MSEQKKEPKEKDELTDEELEGTTGGTGTATTTVKKPQISIQKIPGVIGPTSPIFDPSKVMHSPNNAT